METIKSKYQLQAEKFLEDTKTSFSVRFLFTGPYFEDDKDHRDVYEVTLERQGLKFIFKFGQSLNNSSIYKRKKPSAYDVLACLTKYDPGTFKDFCADYGYDEDSRKAEKIYFVIQEEWQNVRRMFSDVLTDLAEIA